jgi:tetratricopeptide (TPR) repeat protein
MLFIPLLVQLATAEPLPTNVSEATWLQSCIALTETDPARAYEEGMAWSNETSRTAGYRCAAVALVELGRPEAAARRFEALGGPLNTADPVLRAELLSQAGAAWILAGAPAQAVGPLGRAIALMQDESDYLPDLLIERAEAYALMGEWRQAEEDLNRALDIRGADALALRLRSETRMRQSVFALAVADAEAAVAADPQSVEARLALGRAREAQRLGQPID